MITLGSMSEVGMKKRKLEFSSHPGNLCLMRSFVRTFLDNLPIPERDRTLMVLGDEGCCGLEVSSTWMVLGACGPEVE